MAEDGGGGGLVVVSRSQSLTFFTCGKKSRVWLYAGWRAAVG